MTPPDVVAHFQLTPWCAELIRDASFKPDRMSPRVPKGPSEDSFFTETLATDRTVRAWLTLAKQPDDDGIVQEIRTLIDIGSGVNGHANISHGGFVATLLDEILGFLIAVNREKLATPPMFTAYLSIKYRNPLPTPSVIVGVAKYTKLEPRKHFITGTLEDGKGTVYASAEALFVPPRSKM